MGRWLDACCNDAWDVVRGRKKIVGNEILPVENLSTFDRTDSPYDTKLNPSGWLAPDGTFYPVPFGEHETWALKWVQNEYRAGNLTLKDMDNYPNDILCTCGWILIHNPHRQGLRLTRDQTRRVTKRQKNYLKQIGYLELLNDEFL